MLLSMTAIACNPFNNRTVRNLPGVRQIVGPGEPVYQSSILGLSLPQGVAVANDGSRLYVAEGDGDRGIKAIDLNSRTVLGTFVPPGTTSGTRKPMGLAVAPSGVLYSVDRLRLVVDMFDPEGNWLGILPDPDVPGGQWQPLGVVVDSDGLISVTNGSNSGSAVAQYNGNGLFIGTYGLVSGDTSGLSYPTGMAIGKQGVVWMSDSNNGRIVSLDSDGRIGAAYGRTVGPGSLALPRGIVIDGKGYCYVTDVTSHDVKVWDIDAEPANFLFTFGTGGISDGEFLYPNAIAVDDSGKLYIADTGNDRIQIWSY